MTSQDRVLPLASKADLALYLKLSSFYFFYFALLGGLAPYLGLFLEDAGYGAIEISQLTAILMVTKVVAPNVWGWLGDHYGKRLELVRFGSLLALISFLAFFIQQSFWWYVLAMALFSFFWNAVLPQFEVITLYGLGEKRERYGRVRLWGSLGFVGAVVLFGFLFDYISIAYLPHCLTIIIALIWLSSLCAFSQPPQSSVDIKKTFLSALKSPSVIAFLLFNFLLQLSHGPYYTFYSIYMEDLGYERSMIGVLWAVGVVAEVVLFVFMHRFLQRFSMRNIVLISLLLTSVRWLLTGAFADNWPVVILAQCLHAASFGAMHAVAIHFVHQYFPDDKQGQGQAVYSSVSFGAGGALGALLSGAVVDNFGSAVAFYLASIISAAGLMIAYLWFESSLSKKNSFD